MWESLKIAIHGLLRSRKFLLYLIALASTGATAVLTQDAAAGNLFWDTLLGGAVLVAGFNTIEDSSEKIGGKQTETVATTETPKAPER